MVRRSFSGRQRLILIIQEKNTDMRSNDMT
jgi:hypothetical protein